MANATDVLKSMASELKSMRSENAALQKQVADLAKVQSKSGHTPETIFATVRDDRIEKQQRGFNSPREFLMEVMKAFQSEGRVVDKRLKSLAVSKAAGSDEQTGIHDAYGGFLVPTGFSPNMLQVQPENDPIAGRTTNIPMDKPTVKIPARVDKNHTTSVSGGLTVTRRPETVAATASRMQVEQLSLEANTLTGLAFATNEILTDSPISFAAILAAGFKDQFTYHMIKERISGTGVGEFLGVLNSACLVTVAAEAGQGADTINATNVDKMMSRCWGYDQAIWLANHNCIPQLNSLNRSAGSLGGAVVFNSDITKGLAGSILGRPLFFTEYCKTVGDVGDLILGNWSEYLESIYQPLESEESIHVRFSNSEKAFRFTIRNAGMPWWSSALTPVNATDTLSPFVALAAR